ncbi:hypothetical protein Ddc_00419 [Ditylenchus destructor]|nr:hypothetical protein Ddc_00419 [Ditylenchus destructor]
MKPTWGKTHTHRHNLRQWRHYWLCVRIHRRAESGVAVSIFLVTEPTQGWLLFGGGTAALKYMPNYYFVAVALWRADCIGQSFRDKELHSPKYILGAHSCEGKWALCPMVACRSSGGLDHYCKTRDYLKPCIPFMNSTEMLSLVTSVQVHYQNCVRNFQKLL